MRKFGKYLVCTINKLYQSYTGNTLTPASLSITGAITGCDKIGPIIGIDLKNCTITPKKSPNKPIIPNDSIMKPMNVHLIKIKIIPNKKKIDPRLLFGLVKKITVFCEPMINMTPIRNNTLPNANKARSKNVIIPNTKKRKPPNVNATPNSRRSSETEEPNHSMLVYRKLYL